MKKQTQFGIFTNKCEAERTQAEAELYQLDRERALEDIARLVRRFDLTVDDVCRCIGKRRGKTDTPAIKPFEPYFGGR